MPVDGVPPGRMPRHVAVIMDGNGRWAKRRALPRAFGHRKGVTALKGAVRFCSDHGIPVLTVYAFSTENWQRPSTEVKFLMELMKKTFTSEIDELHQEGVRIRFIGERNAFSSDITEVWNNAESLTKDNDNVLLNIAFNYGGRRELVLASRALAAKAAAGVIEPGDIDEDSLSAELLTTPCEDPDLLIRTAGQCRVSNFLLWQLAYTEIHVTDVLWPDFSDEDFKAAIVDFSQRDRKFGRVLEM